MTHSPFGQTLLDVSTVCAIFWAVALIRVEYVGPVAVFIAASCGVLWLAVKIRQAFTFASYDMADFVAGKTKRVKPAENPLMRDPFYSSVITQIEEARAKHKPVKHLLNKRDNRVRELLGTKGMA